MEKRKFLFTRINTDDNHRDIITIQTEADYDGMQRWLNVNYNTEDKVEMLFRAKNKLIAKQDLNPFLKECKTVHNIPEAFEWQTHREKWIKVNIESLYDLNYPV